MCSIFSKEYKPHFLNWDAEPSPEPGNDNQMPMVVENDTKGDSDKKVTPHSGSDATSGSGQESSSNRGENSTNTDADKRTLEESDFTRPQEELLFL